MGIENKFERCEPDDPNRCQAPCGKEGQCHYKAQQKDDGSFYTFCPRHLAAGAHIEEKKRVNQYRLGKWQARMEQFSEHDEVKSLRSEVGIARMLLEEIVGACNDTSDIIMASNRISDLVIRIEKLVSSCHKLEASSGLLIDKATLLRLADTIVDIIGNKISDEELVSAIAFDIVKEIGTISNGDTT